MHDSDRQHKADQDHPICMSEIISDHQLQGVAGGWTAAIVKFLPFLLIFCLDTTIASDSRDKLVVILQYNYIIGIKFYIYCLLCLNNVTLPLEKLVPKSR